MEQLTSKQMRLQGCLNSYVSILLSSELEGNFENVEKTHKNKKTHSKSVSSNWVKGNRLCKALFCLTL